MSRRSWHTSSEESNALKARWKQEKEAIAKVRELKENIERLKAGRAGSRHARATSSARGKIQYGELPQLEQQVAKLSAADGRQAGAHAEGRG